MRQRTARRTRAGANHLVAAVILAGPPAVIAQTSQSSAAVEPYSRITVRIGQTRAMTLDQLHRYYPGNAGLAFQVETPFDYGLLGLTFDYVNLHGATSRQVNTLTDQLALDWRTRVPIGARIAVRPGMRVGDFHMRFDDTTAAPGMQATEEFLIGATGAIDVHITRRLAATLEGAWLFLPSATRAHLGYGSLFASYDMNTPKWLRDALR